jgi:16S rRNA (guanine527-N7)-methyltransferase
MLEAARIADLLQPFLTAPSELAGQLRTYLDLLLRWNTRMSLTAVRDPEQIVIRHFGESLFAARVLHESGAIASHPDRPTTLTDIGSGSGFPGIPIKLYAPAIHLTLLESQNKKATFLREVVRVLGLEDVQVAWVRAERWERPADVVTLRAVEKFGEVLPIAKGLVAKAGRLCLLIGCGQSLQLQATAETGWRFSEEIPIPFSDQRVLVVGKRNH